MVSTRHSISANEVLVSLDIASPSASFEKRSTPLKRTRQSAEETPETQNFVDARATPFEQRKADRGRILKVSSRTLNRSDTGTPVDDKRHDSEAQENTTDVSEAENSEHSITKNSDKLRSEDDETSLEDSDDEAPEAISNIAGAELAKTADQSRKRLLDRQAEEAAQKRRRHQQKLLQQKEQLRQIASTKVTASPGTGESVTASQRQGLPRFLPDEVLMAPIGATVSQLDTGTSGTRSVKHRRFEHPKELKSLQKGSHIIRLAESARRDMAPKSKHQTLNTKNSWLYQRGQKGRRPLKKTLT